MQLSKAFRASLGALTAHEIGNLMAWAARSCALYSFFRNDRSSVVLVAIKDQPRSSQSFSRTIRSACRAMGVGTNALRGHWCHLLSEREALAVISGGLDLDLHAKPHAGTSASAPGSERDVKTICLA